MQQLEATKYKYRKMHGFLKHVLWEKVANKMQNTIMQNKYSYINHHYTLYNEILTFKDIFQAQYVGIHQNGSRNKKQIRA